MKQHNLIKNFINWLQWFLYVSSPVKIVEEKDDIDKDCTLIATPFVCGGFYVE